MSDAILPKFAKTNGGSSHMTQRVGLEAERLSKDGSGVSAFFKTLKKKLSRAESISPESAGQTTKFSPEDKTYFIKAGGQSAKARPFAQSNKIDSSTAADLATLGDVDGLKRYLNLGGDVEDIDSEGNTAMHHACEAGFVEIVDLLADRGADLNARNEEGETPLHTASRQGHEDVVQSILKRKADPNTKNKDGWTGLHEAAMKGAIKVVQALLDHGADPAICTNEGDTPLHKAARWNQLDIAKLLLTFGANPGARDKLGRVPGERTNKVEIVQMLQRLVDQRNEQQEQTSRSHDDDPRPGTSSASGSSSAGFYDDDDRWGIEDQSDLYQTQWALFVSNRDPARNISYSDVPWPGASVNASAILQVVLHGTQTQEERKKRLRTELLRWHPDKFQALFGKNLKSDDAEQIMAKVKEISQAINTAAQQK